MNKILIALFVFALSSAGVYFYLENKKIESITIVGSENLDKTFTGIVDTLANPDNCIASLQRKSAISDKSVLKIQQSGKETYPSTSTISDDLSISSYELKNLPSDVKKNIAFLTILFRERNGTNILKKVRLYVEVDNEDKISYCHALSSSLDDHQKKNATKAKLRVVHAKAQGIEAQQGRVKTSIAAAQCPEGYLMTGCSGSVEGCEASGEVLRKVGPQALNPNVCEVRVDASAICPATALALAICAKIIDE